ncbi:MAG: family 20 glycosylhydrolase [Ignavibacteriae bacterium]|nr:family 20 glycosylhydrolase [Ignavibacteriota bacterium]
MKKIFITFTLIIFMALQSCSTIKQIDYNNPNRWNELGENSKLDWRAVHLLHYNSDKQLEALSKNIPKLTSMGINKIIFEIDYNFYFQSHSELRQTDSVITKEGAKNFTKVCRENGIEIIPQFQCVGHQSWAEETYKLLEVYPEFDLTPNAFPNNKGLYCREWDVENPKVYEIVFALLDEIIDAFDAKAMHVGMDEVFLLGSEFSPSTKGKDPAKLFAKAVNDLHNYIVKEKGLEMLMWGDRLIDANKINYGEWESSANETSNAIDVIPKDIIICDWHYEDFNDYKNLNATEYLSIPMFIEKGFRVLPTSWRRVETMKDLMYYSLTLENPKMLGHLFTLWSSAKGDELLAYPPMVEGLKVGQPFFLNNK